VALAFRLWRGKSGAVAPTVALSLFGLIAAGGLAFDYARMATMDTELQNAADQAALAAASQLTGEAGACARASGAAVNFLTNQTLFATKVNGSVNVSVTAETTCDAVGNIKFWQDKNKANAATTDANARFVELTVNGRQANFALTPIVAAMNSGTITATAMAGLGSAVCKVPPVMICNPNPGTAFNANGRVGQGVQVVAHQNGSNWSPGNFGYLNVGQTNNGAPDLQAAVAYQNPALTCATTSTADVDPGNLAQDAANTRFDIYNFSSGNGTTLGACYNGACPAAQNVTKDLVRPNGATGNNACKIHNSGWQLPTNQFSPRAKLSGDTTSTLIDADGLIDAMGLPRDSCHYTSYNSACTGGRIGDGNWARGQYFAKYHSTGGPSNPTTITRYQTYLWEIANNNMPQGVQAGSGNLRQQGAPVCSTGTLDPTRDRRILTVAIVDNCASLSGGSNTTPAQISEWVDMFLVEPSVNRGNGASQDDLYLEIVREATAAGNGTNGQIIRRDVPYLVE